MVTSEIPTGVAGPSEIPARRASEEVRECIRSAPSLARQTAICPIVALPEIPAVPAKTPFRRSLEQTTGVQYSTCLRKTGVLALSFEVGRQTGIGSWESKRRAKVAASWGRKNVVCARASAIVRASCSIGAAGTSPLRPASLPTLSALAFCSRFDIPRRGTRKMHAPGAALFVARDLPRVPRSNLASSPRTHRRAARRRASGNLCSSLASPPVGTLRWSERKCPPNAPALPPSCTGVDGRAASHHNQFSFPDARWKEVIP